MSLHENDLVDTVLSKISIDEFEPKTGESKDVVVVGYYTSEQSAGEDIYSFFNSSIVEFRDVEVSPNPNSEGYYMVFVELSRDENTKSIIQELTKDLSNVAGNLRWKFKTHLTDEYQNFDDNNLSEFLIDDPSQYRTREDFDEEMVAQEQQALEEKNNAILKFLQHSSLKNVEINENVLTMNGRFDTAKLEIVGFGDKEIMKDIGISESAIEPIDTQLKSFNNMLGEMRAVKIAEHYVIFHPHQNTVLVTKECLA